MDDDTVYTPLLFWGFRGLEMGRLGDCGSGDESSVYFLWGV